MNEKGDPTVHTRVAFSGMTEHWFRNRAVFRDLTGKVSWAELLFLGVSGELPPEGCRQLLDELAAVITAADGRIWPLKAGRLLASFGHPIVGVATSLLFLEDAPLLGPWTSGAAAAVLLAAEKELSPDATELEIRSYVRGKGRLVGWGVALRKEDERYLRLKQAVIDAGRSQLKYWQIHAKISAAMKAEKGLEPNLAIGYGAALLDLNMRDVSQIGLFVVMLCAHLVAAHGIECAKERYPSYLRLPMGSVRYVGKSARSLPEEWDDQPPPARPR